MKDIPKIARSGKNRTRIKQTAVVALVILLLIGSVPFPIVSAQEGTDNTKCLYGPPAGIDRGVTDNLEVVLVNDLSESIGSGGLDSLKEANTQFLSNLESPDEVGAVAYVSESRIDHSLTTDYGDVEQTIDSYGLNPSNITSAQETNGAPAIQDGQDVLLNNSNANSENNVMIILTDGQFEDQSSAVQAAQQANESGITVYAVGLGSDVSDSDLIDITGDEDRYFTADQDNLNEIYSQISSQIGAGDAALEINTRALFEPGATHEYEVIYNNTSTGERSDVTDQVDLTSTDSSLLSVDNQDNTLTATSNQNVSNWVRLDGTYENSTGCTNVVISSPKTENLEILPTFSRFEASLTDKTLQFIIIATMLAVGTTLLSTSFAGLAVYQLAITAGWFIGWVQLGIALVSLFVVLFVGLNMAANIDYSVRR